MVGTGVPGRYIGMPPGCHGCSYQFGAVTGIKRSPVVRAKYDASECNVTAHPASLSEARQHGKFSC